MKSAFKSYDRSLILALTVGLSFLLPFGGASAQTAASDAPAVPSDFAQEVMIKTTLSDFSEASISGDYSVVWALSSKQFQDTFSPDKLKETYKLLADPSAYLGVILAMKPVPKEAAKIDADGVLTLDGYFETSPSKTNYHLEFYAADGKWRVIGMNVNFAP